MLRDALELALDLLDARLDLPAVGLDLRLAGAAEEAEAAALALKVRPRAHQPALLVIQMRKLDLQPALLRLRALAENFEDQPGAVEHLRRPGLFEIALLDRAERMIDDDELGVVHARERGDLLDLACADAASPAPACGAARSARRRRRARSPRQG